MMRPNGPFIFFCRQQVHAPSQKHVPRITSEKNLHNKTENLSHTLDTSVCMRAVRCICYIFHSAPFNSLSSSLLLPYLFMLSSLCARLTPCSSDGCLSSFCRAWVYTMCVIVVMILRPIMPPIVLVCG
jgi:hypothetical protein